MSHEYEYEYEQEREDGSLVNWTLVYEVERPCKGSRDEPPSGGVAHIYEIKHAADGSVLPSDSWETAGFTAAEIERLEERCYESWADVDPNDDGDRAYDAWKDRKLDREFDDKGNL